jgi:bifunctional UDP-N-acetylglucosamine pyrophosphorylase/glucosamine-1-phosphate N-acetyltransferase
MTIAAAAAGGCLALLTARVADPHGLGRIVRDAAGAVLGIVEERDATPEQRTIAEIYTGLLAAPTTLLRSWVGTLTADNAQREYYLTDVVKLAHAAGVPVAAQVAASEEEVLGVNDRAQLAALERIVQRRQAQALLVAGTTLADPARFDLRGTLACGRDVTIDVGCVFAGDVRLGDGVTVGPYCVVKDATVGAGTVLAPFTHVEAATIGEDCRIGPYARLRPGATLADEVHIGNFVEVKASTVGRGSKANHLAYLGDAVVGSGVNVGAGSITANYDGANKHRTEIGDRVSIGSNCVLVAPVTVGAGATIGAGSVVAKAVPAEQLTVARAKQVSLPGWKRPVKRAKD